VNKSRDAESEDEQLSNRLALVDLFGPDAFGSDVTVMMGERQRRGAALYGMALP
jgi:hypothetical protein